MTSEQTGTPPGSSESSVMHTSGSRAHNEQPISRGRRHNPTRSFLLEGVVAVALVAILTAGFALSSQSSAAPAPLLLASHLAVSGAHTGTAFASDQSLTLHWKAVPGATGYHVQIARSSRPLPGATLFKRPLHQDDTTGHSYQLYGVIGRQLYFWRVGTYTGSSLHYSRVQQFWVAEPRISQPIPLLPHNGMRAIATRMVLAWSRVKGALSYVLQIGGKRPVTVRNTKYTLRVQPRHYSWRVAARVKGVAVYTGPYSRAASFTIRPKPTPTPRPTPTPKPTATNIPAPVAAVPQAIPTSVPVAPTAVIVQPTAVPYVPPTSPPYIPPAPKPPPTQPAVPVAPSGCTNC